MGRWWRPAVAALVMAAVAAGVWALLRYGVLPWLSDDQHPARSVLEGLSWVAAILGLPLAVAAFVMQLHLQNQSTAVGLAADTAQPSRESAGDGSVTVTGGVHGDGSGPTFGIVSGGQVNIGQSPPDPPGPTRT